MTKKQASKPAPWLSLDYMTAIRFYHELLNGPDLTPEQVNANKKRLAENDLFFLLCFVLRRSDMVHPFIFERCREVQAEPDDRLDLWAREHGKSSVITFGLTIFEIINNPEITVGIFSHTKSIARDFLKQIKTELEQNPELHRLWPDIFWEDPQKQSHRWSIDGGIVVKRVGNPKEATVEGHGLVDGMPTGRHYDLMVYDDVVTMEGVSTPEQIKKTTTAFQMSDNLGSIGGRKRYIGTRYHLFDTYRTMMDDKIAVPRIHPAREGGREDGKPVWMSEELLLRKRRVQGPYVFSSQMLLNPVADAAMGFKEEWLRYEEEFDQNVAKKILWRFIIVDPAGSKQRDKNDYTTMWVIGHGADQKYRVLDCIRDRLNLTGRWEALYGLHQKWRPHMVVYEEYGMQADIEHFLFRQKQLMYEFDITPIGGSMPKNQRILRMVPFFEDGRMILPRKIHYIDYQNITRELIGDFIEQEYLAFPVLSHDDMFDCLARIADLEEKGLIQTPATQEQQQQDRSQEMIRRAMKNIESQNRGGESWLTV